MESKDPDKAKIFIKEISTNGNVHTLADLIPKTMPFFYLLAPDYIRLFCEPVMEYTLQWPVTYAFHDLGKSKSRLEEQIKLANIRTQDIQTPQERLSRANKN